MFFFFMFYHKEILSADITSFIALNQNDDLVALKKFKC